LIPHGYLIVHPLLETHVLNPGDLDILPCVVQLPLGNHRFSRRLDPPSGNGPNGLRRVDSQSGDEGGLSIIVIWRRSVPSWTVINRLGLPARKLRPLPIAHIADYGKPKLTPTYVVRGGSWGRSARDMPRHQFRRVPLIFGVLPVLDVVIWGRGEAEPHDVFLDVAIAIGSHDARACTPLAPEV
jgi:hypothetical protein